jgi:hypothetical protein
MNKQLILGDILVNSINDRKLSEIILTPEQFTDDGEIILHYEDFGNKLTPIIFNCKYGMELIFPEINWDDENKTIKLVFGFKIDKNITINLI